MPKRLTLIGSIGRWVLGEPTPKRKTAQGQAMMKGPPPRWMVEQYIERTEATLRRPDTRPDVRAKLEQSLRDLDAIKAHRERKAREQGG